VPAAAPDPLAPVAHAVAALTGKPASADQIKQFRRYLDLLLRWNHTHRLTGLRSADAIARGLFVDSLLFLSQLPPGPLAIADIGAGAGVPGMPLRIVEPTIAPTLIDSRRKPVSFLLTLCRELGTDNVRVLEGRAEQIVVEQPDLMGSFDVVTCRAVGRLDALLSTASKYLRPGGLFVASGPPPGRVEHEAPVGAEWRTVPFPALRLTRVFLVARKPA